MISKYDPGSRTLNLLQIIAPKATLSCFWVINVSSNQIVFSMEHPIRQEFKPLNGVPFQSIQVVACSTYDATTVQRACVNNFAAAVGKKASTGCVGPPGQARQ